MGVRLPSAYQEVEYLEATGTQYIQTSYTPQNADEIVCDFAVVGSIVGAANAQVLFSAGTGTNQLIFLLNNTSGATPVDGAYYKYFASGNAARLFFYPSYDTKYRLEIGNDGTANCNGYSVQSNYEGTVNTALRLMRRADGRSYFKGKCYQFILSNGGEEKLHLIPCYRKADSKPGMYDLVTKQFFTNAGTGEFVVGPDVIDSISPWLVARRRLLMYKEPELYPVGTHILSMYIGDKDGGERRNFESGYGINTSTGEYYATGSGNTYASDVYVPVSPKYTYQKSDWRLNTWCFYDKDKQYISRAPSYNNLNVQTLAKFPANVRYVRIQAYNFANQKIEITRIA